MQRQVLLITTVELGNGQTENINIREGDNTYEVAHEFAMKHRLPREIIQKLAVHLQEKLQVQLQQEAQGKLRTSNSAVFKRLYDEARHLRDKLDEQRNWLRDHELEVLKANKPGMTWISMEMMRDRTAGPFSNYGEMLYAEGLQNMQMKQEKIQHLKEALEAAESANMTFKPQLSLRSRQLWSAVHEVHKTPAWERLADGHARMQGQVEQPRQEQEVQKEQKCTIQPVISSTNGKASQLAQHAVQRFMAKSPGEGALDAVTAAQSVPSQTAGSTADNRSGITPAVATGTGPQNVGTIQRLYEDAMLLMQILQRNQVAHENNKPLGMSSSGTLSSSGIHTTALKRAGLHRIVGTPGTSIAGSIGDFQARAAAPRAGAAATSSSGRAAAAATVGGSYGSISGSLKRCDGINSCAGKLNRGRLSALGSIAEVRPSVSGGRGTVAGSGAAAGLKAQRTTPTGALLTQKTSTAGMQRASTAGTVARIGADMSHRRAWH